VRGSRRRGGPSAARRRPPLSGGAPQAGKGTPIPAVRIACRAIACRAIACRTLPWQKKSATFGFHLRSPCRQAGASCVLRPRFLKGGTGLQRQAGRSSGQAGGLRTNGGPPSTLAGGLRGGGETSPGRLGAGRRPTVTSGKPLSTVRRPGCGGGLLRPGRDPAAAREAGAVVDRALPCRPALKAPFRGLISNGRLPGWGAWPQEGSGGLGDGEARPWNTGAALRRE
jgi:hypothetical protein